MLDLLPYVGRLDLPLSWRILDRFRIVCVLLLCVLLVSCAGRATGISTGSLSTHGKLVYKATSTSVTNPILVKIRFPSLVHPNAQIQFVQAYVIRALGPQASSQALSYTDDVVNSITKTAYFANEFYGALTERLPKDSVIVEPYEIHLTRNAMLTAKTIETTRLPPAVLTVEFVTYHNPDPAQLMDASAVTFGDLVTPLIVVRSDPAASPQTQGLLAASTPIIEPAGFSGRGRFVQPDQLSFVSYLNYGPSRISRKNIPVHDKSPAKLGSVLRLSMQKLKMDADRLSKAAASPGTPSKSPFRSSVKPYVDIIVGILNKIDIGSTLSGQLGNWAEFYDAKSGRAAYAGPVAPALAKRRAYLDKIYQYESRLLSKRSREIYQAVRNGAFGRDMRELVGAEAKLLGERRGLATRQNLNLAATVGFSIFSGVAAYKGETQAASLAQTGATMTEQFRSEARSLSHKLSATFRSEYRAVYRGQHTVSVQFADDKKAETVRSLQDLKRKARLIYKKKFGGGV